MLPHVLEQEPQVVPVTWVTGYGGQRLTGASKDSPRPEPQQRTLYSPAKPQVAGY